MNGSRRLDEKNALSVRVHLLNVTLTPAIFKGRFFPTAMNLGARSRCVFRRRILDHSGTFTSMVFVWSWKVPSLSIYIGK